MLLRTASTRILLNGIPGRSFAHGRGLRQGDALSPMLFKIVMDSHCKLFDKAKECGILDPFRNKHSIPQRMSVYADDVIVFLKAQHEDVAAAKLLLDIFSCSLGLKCNLSKSSLSPVFCEEEKIGEFGSLLNCQIAPLPIKYLGLPLSMKKLGKEDFKA